MNTRQHWQNLLQKYASEGASVDDKELWPPGVVLNFLVGKFLCNIIIKDIEMDTNCFKPNCTPWQIFSSILFPIPIPRTLPVEELRPHPQLVRLYKETVSDDLFFLVTVLSIVSPPLTWSMVKTGGYNVVKADFFRLHYDISSKVIEIAAPQRLYPVFNSLNQLPSVPTKLDTVKPMVPMNSSSSTTPI